MSDRNFFYISGIFSFCVYLFFFLLFILYIKSHNVKKIDAFVKTTVLELDIIVDDKTDRKENVTQNITKNSQKSEEIVKKSVSKSLKTTGNVQSLFANVKVDTKTVKKEIVTNTEKNLTSSRYKAKFEKQTKNEDVSVSKLLSGVKKTSSKLLVSSNQNSNDPYYSKIYEILSSGWNPRVIIDNLFAKVVITIYSDGKFEYRFLQYSGNSQFDENLNSFLTEQTAVLYPKHDKGKKTDIEITFKSKE